MKERESGALNTAPHRSRYCGSSPPSCVHELQKFASSHSGSTRTHARTCMHANIIRYCWATFRPDWLALALSLSFSEPSSNHTPHPGSHVLGFLAPTTVLACRRFHIKQYTIWNNNEFIYEAVNNTEYMQSVRIIYCFICKVGVEADGATCPRPRFILAEILVLIGGAIFNRRRRYHPVLGSLLG